MPGVNVRMVALTSVIAFLVAGCHPPAEHPSPTARTHPPPSPNASNLPRRLTTSHPAPLVATWRLIDLETPTASPEQEKLRRALLSRGKTLYTFAKDGSATAVVGSAPPVRAVWD